MKILDNLSNIKRKLPRLLYLIPIYLIAASVSKVHLSNPWLQAIPDTMPVLGLMAALMTILTVVLPTSKE